jgi:large subunit ribosomal protein L29
MAKKKDYRNMSADELHSELDEARHELMNLRFQMSTGELTDYTRLRITRRNIARMLTALSELERMAG